MRKFPRILGAYSTERTQVSGKGKARKVVHHKIYWLVTQLDDDQFKAQALNAAHVPSGVHKTVSLVEFTAHYAPEYGYFKDHIQPQLEEDHGKGRSAQAAQGFDATFAEEERHRMNQFAIRLRKSGNFTQAAKYYKGALLINADDDHLHFNVARLYYEQGELDKCRTHLKRALELNPRLGWAKQFRSWIDRYRPLNLPR